MMTPELWTLQEIGDQVVLTRADGGARISFVCATTPIRRTFIDAPVTPRTEAADILLFRRRGPDGDKG